MNSKPNRQSDVMAFHPPYYLESPAADPRRRPGFLGVCNSIPSTAVCLLILVLCFCGIAPAQQLQVQMQVLVISATETDPGYEGITAFLDFVGVPYTSLIASKQTLTPNMLADANGGKFQGIILVTDYLSAFDAAEWQALWDYELAYKVRQVTYYTWPSAQYGLGAASAVSPTDQAPLYVKLTAAGQQFFPYLKSSARIPVRFAYTYLAKVVDTATTSLIEDDQGNSIVSTHTFADGRENLTVTCDNWRYLLHSQLMAYGIIDWVTRGIHLGERTVYMTPQIDDIFLDNELFDPQLGTYNPNLLYRLNEADMRAIENWQNSIRNLRNPDLSQFMLTLVFNGAGALGADDSLAKYFSERQDLYNWVNHTYNHLDLTAITYAGAMEELTINHQFALVFPFLRYQLENLVTGAITGLTNPQAMKAMADFGIKYIVSDTSRPEQNNPRPNIGIYNTYAPSVLQIPRHPTNIYTTASTSQQETGHYNAINRAYWGRDLTYEEILDKESDHLLSYMACFDIDPLMFHQSNLRAYDGKRSVLGDLLDTTIGKYAYYMNLPVLSPAQDALGQRMAQHMARVKAGVIAELIPGGSIRLRAAQSAVVPISGVALGNLAGIDTYYAGTYRNYGGKNTSWIKINPGETLVVPLVGGETGTVPPTPPPPATTSATYFPATVTITTGSYDWGTLTSFKALDNDSYDVFSAAISGGRSTDWFATTTLSSSPGSVTRLLLTYKGYYSRASTTQELYLYNFRTLSWEKMDTHVVGNSDDVTVSVLIQSDPQRFVSGTREMRARVRGVRTATNNFYCFANFLSWSVVSSSGVQGNTVPVAQDDSVSTERDTPLVISGSQLLANDVDADGNTLTIESVDPIGGMGGKIVAAGDGSYLYTPPNGYLGIDLFRYSVNDSHGGTASATVRVSVGNTSLPATYFPTSVTVTGGSYDWGDMTYFKTTDNNTYDVFSGAVTGGQATDWYAVSTMQGAPAAVAQLTANYKGSYSRAAIAQELYLYNFQTGLWEMMDKRTVGNTDDVPVSVTISTNPQRYISATGELRLRIRGYLAGTSTFYCWANFLSWDVQ